MVAEMRALLESQVAQVAQEAEALVAHLLRLQLRVEVLALLLVPRTQVVVAEEQVLVKALAVLRAVQV